MIGSETHRRKSSEKNARKGSENNTRKGSENTHGKAAKTTHVRQRQRVAARSLTSSAYVVLSPTAPGKTPERAWLQCGDAHPKSWHAGRAAERHRGVDAIISSVPRTTAPLLGQAVAQRIFKGCVG